MQPGIQNQVATDSFFDDTEPVRSFFAPGRINIIGEHLDYNGGYVFPGAISLGITGTIQYRHDMLVRLISEHEQERFTVDLNDPSALLYDASRGWANYPLGALAYLENSGMEIERGMNILFSSTLPRGSGLSSSAALEILTAYMAATDRITTGADRLRIARLMQSMENEYIGVRCGIMDQFTVALGRKGHAMLLNTETVEYTYVPVNPGNYTFIVINSNKPRRLADSRYNERRGECERALALIRNRNSSCKNIARASIEDVENITDEILHKRARHVVSENRRVIEAVEALGKNDLLRFGALLTESHASLRDDYEVTGPELDALVRSASAANACIGARMTGAGFGGCAIALVSRDAIPDFTYTVGTEYKKTTGLKADFFESGLEDGVRELDIQ
jgi:galactokinase